MKGAALTTPIATRWRRLLLYTLLSWLPVLAVSQNGGVYFGLVNLQMRSRGETSAQELLFSILSQTTTFLEMALKEKFKSTQYDFTHVTLSVEEFSLNASSNEGQYDADCRLQGIAMFEAGAAPKNDDAVKQVVRRALNEENTLFLQALRSSDNPFLQDILFAVVTTEEGDPNFGRPSNTTLDNTSAPESSVFVAAPWMIAVMVAAGVGVLMILSCMAWYCYKSCQNARHQEMVAKMRTASHSSSGSSEEGGAHYRKRSPSIPSPLHSIMSQDSSKFTFNPKSRSTKSIHLHPPTEMMVDETEDDGGEESTSSKHSISVYGVSFYTNSSNVDVDVEAWQKGSTVANASNTSLPFGQDISAIEMHSKRDLSLIEEGENEEMTPHSSVSGGSNCFKSKQSLPHPVRLSLQSLAELERDERKRRRSSSRNKLKAPLTSQPAVPLTRKQQQQEAEARLSLNGSAAAVIDELNDLSAQIDDYRRR